MNLRDLILAADDRPTFPVEVPEWKATVYVRVLTGAERLAISEDGDKDLKTKPFMYRLLVKALCDDKGQQLFTPADIEALSAKNGLVLDTLFDKALDYNKAKREAVDDAKKNSSATPSASS